MYIEQQQQNMMSTNQAYHIYQITDVKCIIKNNNAQEIEQYFLAIKQILPTNPLFTYEMLLQKFYNGIYFDQKTGIEQDLLATSKKLLQVIPIAEKVFGLFVVFNVFQNRSFRQNTNKDIFLSLSSIMSLVFSYKNLQDQFESFFDETLDDEKSKSIKKKRDTIQEYIDTFNISIDLKKELLTGYFFKHFLSYINPCSSGCRYITLDKKNKIIVNKGLKNFHYKDLILNNGLIIQYASICCQEDYEDSFKFVRAIQKLCLITNQQNFNLIFNSFSELVKKEITSEGFYEKILLGSDKKSFIRMINDPDEKDVFPIIPRQYIKMQEYYIKSNFYKKLIYTSKYPRFFDMYRALEQEI